MLLVACDWGGNVNEVERNLPPPFYDSIEMYKEGQRKMALTKDEKRELHEIHIVLMGTDGTPGLAKRFEVLSSDYYKFKRRALFIFGVLLGSGVITGSAFAILNGV